MSREAADTSVTLSQASYLFSSFTNFLTVAIHSILYQRKLYPATTFLSTHAYGLAVHQSRHPGVCAWVRDAIVAAAVQLRAGQVRHVALVVHAPSSLAVLERWIFDVQSFPPLPDEPVDEESVETDAHEALRGALARLAHAAQRLFPLPEGCTFTLALELRDSAEAPIRHPQVWIPSEPGKQIAGNRSSISTVPVRSVQVGPLFFECWVEQVKAESPTPSARASRSATSHS